MHLKYVWMIMLQSGGDEFLFFHKTQFLNLLKTSPPKIWKLNFEQWNSILDFNRFAISIVILILTKDFDLSVANPMITTIPSRFLNTPEDFPGKCLIQWYYFAWIGSLKFLFLCFVTCRKVLGTCLLLQFCALHVLLRKKEEKGSGVMQFLLQGQLHGSWWRKCWCFSCSLFGIPTKGLLLLVSASLCADFFSLSAKFWPSVHIICIQRLGLLVYKIELLNDTPFVSNW